MACKGCDEERLRQAAEAQQFGPTRIFRLPFSNGAELTVTTLGLLTPETYAIVKDWLGLVYDQLRPTEEIHGGA